MLRLRSLATLTIIVVSALTSAVSAQVYQPVSPYNGQITAKSVHVRSGDKPEYYPVTRLSSPAKVEVIGRSGAWLAITPPKGVFSMIAKRHVDTDLSGKIGTVNTNNVRVRCGSLEFPSHFSVIQTHLNPGDKVEIIGQTEEYFKITPPKGVAVYISSAFVKKIEEPKPETTVKPVEKPFVKPVPKPVMPKPVVTPKPAVEAKPSPAVPDKTLAANTDADQLPAPVEPSSTQKSMQDAKTPADTAMAAADTAKDTGSDMQPGSDAASAVPSVETPAKPLTAAEKLLLAIEQFDQAEELLMAEYKKPQSQRDLQAMLQLYESLDTADDKALAERILYRQRYLRLAIQRIEGKREVSDLSRSNREHMNRISSMVASISDIGTRNVSRDMTIIGRLKESRVYKGVGAMPRRWLMYDDLTGDRLLYVEAADSVVNLAGNLNWKVAVVGRPVFIRELSEYVLMAHTVKKLPDGDPSKAPKPKPITTADPIDLPGPKQWQAPDTSEVKVVPQPTSSPEKVLQMENPAPVKTPAEPKAVSEAPATEKPEVAPEAMPEEPKPAAEAEMAKPEAEKVLEPVKVDQLPTPDKKPTPTTGLPMVPATKAPATEVDPSEFK